MEDVTSVDFGSYIIQTITISAGDDGIGLSLEDRKIVYLKPAEAIKLCEMILSKYLV